MAARYIMSPTPGGIVKILNTFSRRPLLAIKTARVWVHDTYIVCSISWIFIWPICNEDIISIVVAIVTIALWAIYCVTFELHLFTRESSNFIYYLYASSFFHHFISILNFHLVTSLFHGSLKVTCVVPDLTNTIMACISYWKIQSFIWYMNKNSGLWVFYFLINTESV